MELNVEKSINVAALIFVIGWVVFLFTRQRKQNDLLRKLAAKMLDPGWVIHNTIGDYVVHGSYRGREVRLIRVDRTSVQARGPITLADSLLLIMLAPCIKSICIGDAEHVDELPEVVRAGIKELWTSGNLEEFHLVGNSKISLLMNALPIQYCHLRGLFLRTSIDPSDEGAGQLKKHLETLYRMANEIERHKI